MEQRSVNDPIFNLNFLKYFPEIQEKVPNAEHFPSFIYSTLRGMAILEILNPESKEVESQLNFIKNNSNVRSLNIYVCFEAVFSFSRFYF